MLKIPYIIFFVVVPTGFSNALSQKCLSRDYGNGGTVCVCNKDNCDTFDPIQQVPQGSFLKYTSDKHGLRFEKEEGNFTNSTGLKNSITIGSDEVFQTINGFGGALTDAAGINILSLDEDLQNKLMRSYFSEEGIEYSLCRVPMGATDFSTHAYTYHDQEDITLSNFTLAAEDYKYKLPLLHWASNLTNNNLKFFVSTWIAPKWMKTNGQYSGFLGKIKKTMYQVWANYFLKFLDAYKNEGITFWGITTGNEPSLGFFPTKIPSVEWTSNTQKIWLRDNLGPTIRNSSHSNIKILILDDQRIFLPFFVDDVFSDPKAYEFADGVALHWYFDNIVPAKVITNSQKKYRNKFFLATEASRGGSLFKKAVQLGNWKRAEEYCSSIIEDVNNWMTGWVDWNMVLDLSGGPTYISNFCDAPIIVNVTGQEFYKQPMFYALGHFAKFVPRESKKIGVTGFSINVPVTAFKRPDGGIVLTILNKDGDSIEAVINDKNRGNIILKLTAHSITTIVYW